MPRTHFTSLAQGTNPNAPSTTIDVWPVPSEMTVDFVQNGATVVDTVVNLPKNSRILAVIPDNLIVFNSGTSNTLSVGYTSGGTDIVSGVDLKTAAGRLAPVYTAAQLTAMKNITTNTAIHITSTPVGTAATTGSASVRISFIPGNN